MPKIDVIRERQRIQGRGARQIASPTAARLPFQGDIALARGLQTAGAGLAVFGRGEQRREERQQREFQAKEEMKRNAEKKVRLIGARQRANELNVEFEKRADEESPDGLEMAGIYTESSKELDLLADEFDDPQAKAVMSAHVSGLKLGSQVRIQSRSDRKSTLAFNDEVEKSTEAKAKLIGDNPFTAPRMLQESREDIDGLGELYGGDKGKVLDETHNFYAKAMMNTFEREGTKNESFAQQGLDILDGKGPKEMVEVAKGLKASEREAFRRKLLRVKDQRQNTSVGELRQNFNDVISFALSGKPPSDSGIRGLRKQINSNTKLETEEKVRLNDTLNSAIVTGEAMRQAIVAPPEQWAAIIGGVEKSVKDVAGEASAIDPSLAAVNRAEFNARDRQQHKSLLQAHMLNIANERRRDPVKFVAQNFRDIEEKAINAQSGDPTAINDYIVAVKAKQDYLKIPDSNQRLLSKDQSFGIGGMVNNAQNSDDLAAVMTGLEQQYGKHFPEVFEEITKDNKLDPQLMVASQFSDFNIKSRVLDNFVNKNDINERAKNVLDFNQKNLDDSLNEKMDAVNRAVASSEKVGFKADLSLGMRDAVELESKRRMAQTNSVNNMDDIVDDTIDYILGSNYDQVEGGNSFFLMPKSSAGRPYSKKMIESFATTYSTSDNLGSLEKNGELIDYSLDPGMVTEFGPLGAKKRWMGKLESDGRWVTNDAGDGIILVYTDPVLGENIPVPQTDGRNVEFKFDEISYNADERTLNEATPFLNKVFAFPESEITPTGGTQPVEGGPVFQTGGS